MFPSLRETPIEVAEQLPEAGALGLEAGGWR